MRTWEQRRTRGRRGARTPLELRFVGQVQDGAVPGDQAPAAIPRGAWYRGRRLVAWDGTMVDLADEPEIEAAFGRPNGGGSGAYPQMRLFALVETGTRVVFGLAGGHINETCELSLARNLLGKLTPGMLCLADRGLVSGRLWRDAAATGADLLWRMKSNQKFPCLKRLPDGSFLSEFHVGFGRTHR